MRWAVMLAGGSGTRFWPLSTPSTPKQLLPIVDSESTAESTFRHLVSLCDADHVVLVTGAAAAGPLMERLGLSPSSVLIEPEAKSTGPALVWATWEIMRRDSSATILSAHADWYLPDSVRFLEAARQAYHVAESTTSLVTVGVVPSRPDTGYGYIVPGAQINGGFRVSRFQEKPSREVAEALLKQGALWNSGLFAWRPQTLLDEVKQHTPELAAGLGHLAAQDVPAFFRTVAPISIDVGVLERSAHVALVRGDFFWDDVGTWEAVHRVRAKDAADNVIVGRGIAIESSGSVVWSSGTPIVVAGLDDVVIVEANGRILAIHKRLASDLKRILDQLPEAIRTV